jgi:hypothetical protein
VSPCRSALNVLEHMPAVTKTTQEHKQYEENLIRQKVRGQAAAVLMDAFQGFAAQVLHVSLCSVALTFSCTNVLYVCVFLVASLHVFLAMLSCTAPCLRKNDCCA